MNKIINNSLLKQIKNLIEQTKNSVAIAVNSSMTMMYRHIGKLINKTNIIIPNTTRSKACIAKRSELK
ncbi:MAG: hypothetical protein RBT59_00645 [Arcobacteraceae bacterium]|jgi:hypothetical protein|nr:hypothetical protein [Arcobacteraceae bacterium]